MTLAKRIIVMLGAGGLLAAAAAPPLVARAGTPNPINVTTGGGPVTYSGTDVAGQPDPTGPPAPACSGTGADGCDRETVNLSGATAQLSLTISYTPSDPTQENCLDIAIENSAATSALAHQLCAPSGSTISDPLAAAGSYTMEVDADNSAAVGDFPQSFMASVLAVPATVTTPAPTPVSANPFTFTHEVSVDVQHGDGEPDVAIDPNNPSTMFTATPWGFSTTVSLMWKSQDAGVQWNNLHGAAAADLVPCPDPAADVLRPDCSRGGGDAEIQFSQPAAPGDPSRVQFEDLNGLDSISCAYSDNGANTFVDMESNTPPAGAFCNEGTNAETCATSDLPGCVTAGTDRPWEQVWPKADQPTTGTCGPSGAACGTSDQLYMVFDTGDQPPNGDASINSPDNGQSWSVGCTTTTGSSCVGGSNGVGSRPGPLVIDTRPAALQVVGGKTYPTLYEFMGTESNGTEVNISCDGGQTWSNIPTSNGLAGSTTNDFVAGTIDSSGEVYTAFSVANDPNPWRVWVNHSIPGSAKKVGNCSAPVQAVWANAVPLTGPPSTADGVGATPVPSQNYAVMPWEVAGDAGRVDVVYYTTTQPVPFSPDDSAATWYMHMAQTLNGGTTWTDEQATETPMHLESICFSGIGCTAQTPPGGDRNLLDFFEVKLDPSGRAVVIFTDDANSAACSNVTCTQGIGLISEVQQATGPSLYSSVGTVPALTSGLSQSLDVRQAGVNADITRNEPTNSVLAAPTDNIAGDTLPAADITDLKVCLVSSAACPVKNTSTGMVALLFTLRNLSGGTLAAVDATEGGTAANWLVTWRGGTPNDLWFAQATQNAADPNNQPACIYGRPSSVYNDGEPKAAEYVYPSLQNASDSPGPGRTNTTTCSVNATSSVVNGQAPNSIEIDVPMDSISGISTGEELYGLTGWTTEDVTALNLPDTVCSVGGSSADNCSGSVGFFSNIAETAPMDVLIGTPSQNTPEAPALPLLIGIGAAAAAGGALLRRRRSARHPVAI